MNQHLEGALQPLDSTSTTTTSTRPVPHHRLAKLTRWVVVASLACGALATASAAEARPPAKPQPTAQSDAGDLLTPPDSTPATWAELRRLATVDGTVPVIVALDVPTKRPHELTAGQHGQQNAAIARVSGRLVRELGGKRVRNLRQLDELPLLTLDADLAVLDLLESSRYVRSVSLDREFVIDLVEADQAVPTPVVDETPEHTGAEGDATEAGGAGVAATSWNGSSTQLDKWWNWYQVGLQSSYQAGYRGAGQTVAIVDTGVESSHAWLSGSVAAEACFLSVNACPNGNSYQYGRGAAQPCTFHTQCSHGTHVAHSAAGSWGVAPDAKIVAIQVFQRGPNGAPTYRESSVINALWYVYQTRSSHRYASVNLSLGTTAWGTTGSCDGYTHDGSGQYLTGWIEALESVGIATVIAAGNTGYYNGVGHPACISEAVTVANTTYYVANGYRYDAFYAGGNRSWIVDLLAPGTDICSAVPGNRVDCGYIGTSMAAPHVAGAFAVLKAKRPHATVDQVQAQLVRTGQAVQDSVSGLVRSRIDVNQAARGF